MVIGMVLAASFWGIGCSSTDAKSAETNDSSEEWLFSLQATGATSFDTQSGMLAMLVGSVLAFTDRPNRQSTSEDPASFVQLWDEQDPDSFTVDPPNVVIT